MNIKIAALSLSLCHTLCAMNSEPSPNALALEKIMKSFTRMEKRISAYPRENSAPARDKIAVAIKAARRCGNNEIWAHEISPSSQKSFGEEFESIFKGRSSITLYDLKTFANDLVIKQQSGQRLPPQLRATEKEIASFLYLANENLPNCKNYQNATQALVLGQRLREAGVTHLYRSAVPRTQLYQYPVLFKLPKGRTREVVSVQKLVTCLTRECLFCDPEKQV